MLIDKLWYKKNPFVYALFPFSLLFRVISGLRKTLYKNKILKTYRSKIPVVVVGNISVGGNGKTPVVVYLVEKLTALGLKVGVVSRGYGAKAGRYPYEIDERSKPEECGDEPKMIFTRCGCPVIVDPVRVRAVKLMEKRGVDLIISDDGLQHYAMERAFEIAVVDGQRRHGNEHLMPMGPLREPMSRLNSVDAIICNGGNPKNNEYLMKLNPTKVLSVFDFKSEYDFDEKTVNALAGIGNPNRFFKTLEDQGFTLNQKFTCPDHARYEQGDILRGVKDISIPVIMTEKDAVKCRKFACKNWYFLRVDADIDSALINKILQKLEFL